MLGAVVKTLQAITLRHVVPSLGRALACALAVLSLGGFAVGQTGDASQYQAYPLQHKSAADVEKVLGEMLAGMGDSTHVVVDARQNQILVRGPEKAQQIVRQMVQSVDRPAPRQAVARPLRPPEEERFLRAYPCPADQQEETAARLRANYSNRNDVRIAADSQSGQLWVLAPTAAHDEIAQRLQTDVAPAIPPQNAGQPVERFVTLGRMRVGEVETTLRELLGGRLAPLSARSAGLSEYSFSDGAGHQVELVFDGRRNGVGIHGPGALASQFERLVRQLDRPLENDRSVRLVPVHRADPMKIRQAVEAYRGNYRNDSELPSEDRQRIPGAETSPRENEQSYRRPSGGVELVSYLFQEGEPGQAAPPPAKALPSEKPKFQPEEAVERLRQLRKELTGDVEIETLPDLDVIILRGRRRDVEEVRRIIEEIERISAETQPQIEIYDLRWTDDEAMLEIIRQVEQTYLAGRQGRLTIVPLFKPNALLLIGWGDVVRAAKELIAKLDQPVDPESQQQTFRLRYASATMLRTTLMEFFNSRIGGLSPRLHITADPRTNALIVHGPKRDVAELELLLEKLDVAGTPAVLQTRIFRLENTLATDLFATLQAAINAARGGPVPGAPAAAQKSAALELLTRDPAGQKLIRSGILSDVQITPDPRLNVLIVAAPAESMDLLAALIRELDSPGFVAQIKVFRMVNADAATMIVVLRSLLPADLATPGPQLAAAAGEPSVVGLRFSVDPRTNSIIAVGSTGVLQIVEALLLRLDAQDVQQRRTSVYRLKNAPAIDVANAVNMFLRSERQVQLAVPGALSPFQQIESEVVVVPEPVSNALIISTTPRFYEDIMEVVEKLDSQPAQVMIQVLIAEVQLRDTDEFGVELGLQDSVLFDRSVLAGNLAPRVTTVQQSTPSGIITSQQTDFPAATLDPGFQFNSPNAPNGGNNQAISSAGRLGGQSLSSFGVGRINSELGFGGLVLSASNESVSVLVRALQESRRLEVLGRPHIRTLDNQPAFIQIGARVPRITGTSVSPTIGQVNQLVLENVGLILGVTPRISPEGMVVMEIDAERSELGPENEGIPVSIVEGNVIRSPRINTTMAQATVSASDGETIILGGLITKNTVNSQRKVPYLSDIPLLGNLFKYHLDQTRRTELLIVLTPHVVRNSEDEARLKRVESARMHWCLEDVQAIFGDSGMTRAGGTPDVIYPDLDPHGKLPPGALPGEPVPAVIPDLPGEPVPTPAPLRAPMPPMGPAPEGQYTPGEPVSQRRPPGRYPLRQESNSQSGSVSINVLEEPRG